jgi:hypothetical protein
MPQKFDAVAGQGADEVHAQTSSTTTSNSICAIISKFVLGRCKSLYLVRVGQQPNTEPACIGVVAVRLMMLCDGDCGKGTTNGNGV